MPCTKGGEKVRVNLEVDPRVRDRFEHLQRDTDAPSLTEVFRRALQVYEMVVAHEKNSGTFILRHSDGAEERMIILF